MAKQETKLGYCDSCGSKRVLIEDPYHRFNTTTGKAIQVKACSKIGCRQYCTDRGGHTANPTSEFIFGVGTCVVCGHSPD